MKVGGQRRLFIFRVPLAYGEAGRPPVIPPKSELVFDIEVMAVSDTTADIGEPAAARAGAAVPDVECGESAAVAPGA